MRLYRVSFVAGFAVGFVAGSRAGREKYDQMVKLAKATAENPAVQQAAGAIQAQASSLASTAASKVSGQLHDKVPQIAQNAARTVSGHLPGLKHGSGAANGATDGDRSVAATNGQGKRAGE
jgi:hypothetical protein